MTVKIIIMNKQLNLHTPVGVIFDAVCMVVTNLIAQLIILLLLLLCRASKEYYTQICTISDHINYNIRAISC